jgi:hypothetical protein
MGVQDGKPLTAGESPSFFSSFVRLLILPGEWRPFSQEYLFLGTGMGIGTGTPLSTGTGSMNVVIHRRSKLQHGWVGLPLEVTEAKI